MKEFAFQETYKINEELSDKANNSKVEKQILKSLKKGISLKTFKVNGVFDEGEAEVVVTITGSAEDIKKWWKQYGGNNDNIKKGANIVEASTTIAKLMSLEEYKDSIKKELASNKINDKDILSFINDQYDNMVDSFIAGIDPNEFTRRYLYMLVPNESTACNEKYAVISIEPSESDKGKITTNSKYLIKNIDNASNTYLITDDEGNDRWIQSKSIEKIVTASKYNKNGDKIVKEATVKGNKIKVYLSADHKSPTFFFTVNNTKPLSDRTYKSAEKAFDEAIKDADNIDNNKFTMTYSSKVDDNISAADLNRAIKKYFKDNGIDVSATSTQTKNPYIRVIAKGDKEIPNDIRKNIASFIYKNEDFSSNENINYGNIMPRTIAIKAKDWIVFLNKSSASISIASLSTKAQKRYDAIKEIVEEGQYAKISGVIVDGTTASVVLKVCDALSEEKRNKLLELPVKNMINVVWKLVK